MPLRSATSRRLLLAVIPAAVLCLGLVFLQAKGPFWLGLNLDPDYPYLLNSVNVAQLRPSAHTHHPGSTCHLLGAAFVKTFYALTAKAGVDLADDVLQRPEDYLRGMAILFMVLFAASLWLLGEAAWVGTRSRFAVVLCQLTPLLSATIHPHLACAKPEPVVLAASTAVAALALAGLASAPGRTRASWGALLGVALGAALATKLNALPLFLVIPLLLVGWRAIASCLGAAALSLAALTVPAWKGLSHTLILARRIATHEGSYGSGDYGLLNPGSYVQNFANLLLSEPAMLVGLGLGVLLLALDRRVADAERPLARRTLAALLVAQIAVVALVARQPADEALAPGDRYLFPGLALTGTVLALCWLRLSLRLKDASRPMRLGAALAALLFAGYLTFALYSQHSCLASARERQLEISRAAHGAFPFGNVLRYYRSSSVEYALHFGDTWAGKQFQLPISKAHPYSVFFSIFTGRFEPGPRWEPDMPCDLPRPIGVQGTPLTPEQKRIFPCGLLLRELAANSQEALYVLE